MPPLPDLDQVAADLAVLAAPLPGLTDAETAVHAADVWMPALNRAHEEHLPGLLAAVVRVRDLAMRCRTITCPDDQLAETTLRALGDQFLRALNGEDLPEPRVAGETWPPPVIGTDRRTRPPMDGRALIRDFRTHVLGETHDG